MDDPWINGSSREFTVSITGCAYHAELILGTGQIVYLLYVDACPTIAIPKNEIEVH